MMRNRSRPLQLSVDLGCNFFDTAWAYGEGKSDGLLGETMQRNAGKRLYAASRFLLLTIAGRHCQNTSTATFSRQNMYSNTRISSGNSYESTALMCCNFTSGMTPGRTNPSFARPRKAEERWHHPFLWPKPESLGAMEWPKGDSHWAGRYCAGDLQHLRPGPAG